jgi:hypothetical protein
MTAPQRKQTPDLVDQRDVQAGDPGAILWRIPCACCGGPVIVDDATRVLACEYCRETHLLDRSKRPVHLAKPTCSQDEAMVAIKKWLRDKGHRATSLGEANTVLIPYWRYHLRILRFASVKGGDGTSSGASTELFTTMIPAIREAELVPIPVGPIPEITECSVALAHLVPKEMRVVRITGDEGAAQRLANESQFEARSELGEGYRECNVEEIVSVFYRPFHLLRYSFRSEHYTVIACGVTGRVTGRADGDLTTRLEFAGADEHLDPWALPEQRPLGCPECSGPMTASVASAVYACSSCNKLWSHSGVELEETRSVIAGGDGDPLPFWRITLRERGDGESSSQTRGLWVAYVPAFQPCPSGLVRRLTTNMTLAMPRYDECPGVPSAAIECSLSAEAAGRIAKLVLFDPDFADRSADAPIPEATVEIERSEVIWIPFRADRGFLHDMVTGTAISEGVFGD